MKNTVRSFNFYSSVFKRVMSRKKRKNKGSRSGKLHKALCEKDVNGGGKFS